MRCARMIAATTLLGLSLASDGSAGSRPPAGSIFDPRGTALGTVSTSHTNLTFDTGTGEWWLDSVLQGSTAPLETNESGQVAMRVYRFTNFDSSGIANIAVQASGPIKPGLVIASQGDLTLASVLDMSGKIGSWGVGGKGGSGGEGSGNTNGFSSLPPPTSGGDGGTHGANRGRGYGGGLGGESNLNGGGGYGGNGGNGASSGSEYPYTGSEGVAYGDPLLNNLFGGSGGGARTRSVNQASGGGGGGALALLARGRLFVSGTLLLKGGNGNSGGGPNFVGSGGSGGGLILAGARLDISGATMDVRGGNGYNDTGQRGGGGGGGRVAFYSNRPVEGLTNFVNGAEPGADTADNVVVIGGVGPNNAEDGEPGTFESQAGPMPFAASGGTVMLFR